MDERVVGLAGIADAPAGRHDRPGEQVRVVGAPRKIRGAEAGSTALGEIAASDLRLAQLAEQFRVQPLVAVAPEMQGFDRIAQVVRGLFVGELIAGHARRPPRIFDRELGGVRASPPGNNGRRSRPRARRGRSSRAQLQRWRDGVSRRVAAGSAS